MFHRCLFLFSQVEQTYLGDVLIREKFTVIQRKHVQEGSFMTTNNRQQTTTAVSLNEKAVIRKLSLCSILGNTVLSGFKLFAGVTGHSGAMISDAIHSFSDVLTTFIAWFEVKISKKAPTGTIPMAMSGWNAWPRWCWGQYSSSPAWGWAKTAWKPLPRGSMRPWRRRG